MLSRRNQLCFLLDFARGALDVETPNIAMLRSAVVCAI
jgi:hypothetical protein